MKEAGLSETQSTQLTAAQGKAEKRDQL